MLLRANGRSVAQITLKPLLNSLEWFYNSVNDPFLDENQAVSHTRAHTHTADLSMSINSALWFVTHQPVFWLNQVVLYHRFVPL